MKKRAIYTSFILLVLLLAASVSAQAWRGVGRLSGVVTDPDGKPIQGAEVVLRAVRGSDSGPDPVKTDAKGRWAAGGLIGGTWNIDITAPGFLTKKISANVSELDRLVAPIKVSLDRKPEEKPKVEEREAIVVGGVEISPEIARAIDAGNAHLKAERWTEAASEYEKALAVLHTNATLKFAIARAYYGSGELKKAIAYLQEVHDADNGNVTAATLLADMLLEDEQIDEGQKVLAAIPQGALKDPNTIINIGIRFINNEKPELAHRWFNEAVSVAPDMPAAYYYRGIASLQLKKMAEAKADFQKVVSLDPQSSEAEEARDLLAQIK